MTVAPLDGLIKAGRQKVRQLRSQTGFESGCRK